VTYGTTDTFLEQFSLPSLADLPGMVEMRAAGLLDLNVPADFMIPDPTSRQALEEAADLDAIGEVEFVQDFLPEPAEADSAS
jgi:segregation and condensation protein B